MSEHLNDQLYQEEIERFVAWWRRNGGRLLVGLLVLLAAAAAWRWYEGHRQSQRRRAAVRYAAVTAALAHGPLVRADMLARKLVRRNPSSPYALFAALALARAELAAGHPREARFFAGWARRHPGLRAWRGLVLFRVAEIDLGLGHPRRALAVLRGVDPGRYALLFALARAQAARALHEPRREFDALGLVATLAPPGSGWGRWARSARRTLLPAIATPPKGAPVSTTVSPPRPSRAPGSRP